MEEIEFDEIIQEQGGETQALKVNQLFKFLRNYKNVYYFQVIYYRLTKYLHAFLCINNMMEQNSAFQMTQQIPRKSQTSSAATETPEKKYFDIRRVSSKKKKVI